MIHVQPQMDNVANYIGAVKGILSAIEHPNYEGDFVGDLMGELSSRFNTDTLAAHRSGAANISHVFEWGSQDADGVSMGQPSSIPLYRLTKKSNAAGRYMSYTFLPSTKPVPLPDPDKYGFKAEKLAFMRRHVFKMKAVVMETQSNVTIAPRFAKKLFIPDANHKYGYYMSSRAHRINPGGSKATGQFRKWWFAWFQTRAQGIISEQAEFAEQHIKASGQKVIRHLAGTKINGVAVGGRFASGTSRSFSYIPQTTAQAERMMLAEAKRQYDDDDWEGDM